MAKVLWCRHRVPPARLLSSRSTDPPGYRRRLRAVAVYCVTPSQTTFIAPIIGPNQFPRPRQRGRSASTPKRYRTRRWTQVPTTRFFAYTSAQAYPLKAVTD